MAQERDRAALAQAREEGIAEGLRLASERISAYLEYLSGDPHSYVAEVIAGRITGEMVAPELKDRASAMRMTGIAH
ncbi:hypothetical protein [Microvirga sp. CF3016]|uniref:hypothetical protein n=1 Tax=Microvirga sp. CF3016 TaxID=3110181 RepID=UPI002E769376|nr:hypothetical protein [Microvirga sp. CF3016]MEE1612071.1 hypothetical protein [Microvirga sp. CF3016]